jgi:flagellar hook-basal body complex protein FliE
MLESPRLVGSGSGAAEAADRKSEFSDILEEAVARVENYRAEADRAVDRFLRGEDQEIHRVALAVQESEIAMELFLQAKNKVVQAYQEVMRMQL